MYFQVVLIFSGNSAYGSMIIDQEKGGREMGDEGQLANLQESASAGRLLC